MLGLNPAGATVQYNERSEKPYGAKHGWRFADTAGHQPLTLHCALTTLLGNRTSRKLAHNTYAERGADDVITIRLHGNPIVTAYPDGCVGVSSCGWRTATTKERFNRFLPYGNVYQKAGKWYYGDEIPFRDGMVLSQEGEVIR